MPVDGVGISAPANDLEVRLARLEQRSPTIDTTSITTTVDQATGTATQDNPLDYTVGSWQPLPTLSTSMVNGVLTSSWSDGVEGLLTPTASRVGNMVFLTGVIKFTGATLGANTNLNLSMFKLPNGWRPVRSVLLTCPCGVTSTTPPGSTAQAGVATIMIVPNLAQTAGLVKLVTATLALSGGANGGWISLCGGFPSLFTADAPTPPSAGTWAAVPNSQSWDQVHPSITWETWPNLPAGSGTT